MTSIVDSVIMIANLRKEDVELLRSHVINLIRLMNVNGRENRGVSLKKRNLRHIKCSEYILYDGDDPDWLPCNCPVCGGFLKWNHGKPICNKCGADLIVIPDRDEETGEELEWGKICPISLRRKKRE